MILLIDNYDSFTYNLYQMAGKIHNDIQVYRNDNITCAQVAKMNPSHIIFSPGPKTPKEAGNMEDIIDCFYQAIPMLGICLGHQAICEVFGADIVRCTHMMHGEASCIEIDRSHPLFQHITSPMQVGRYHSLIATTPNAQLQVIARSVEGDIMAVAHRKYPVFGIQFHPESILTPQGNILLENFLVIKKVNDF